MESKATPYSNLKIFAHPEKIKSIAEGDRTAPLYVRIKPTNKCNHNCNYCHYASGQYLDLQGQENRNQIPWEMMQEIIKDLADMGVKAVTFSGGGEPLLYPRIIEAMQQLLEYDIDLSIITNGSMLKGDAAELLARAKWVRISLDAGTRETYSQIRGISLESFPKVCANIEKFALLKQKECELGINFVVNKENSGEIYAAGKLMHDLGVNHIKYTARMTNNVDDYHKDFKEQVMEQIKRVKKEFQSERFNVINLYESDFDLSAKFERQYRNCAVKEIVTVIAADCKVYYCHDKAYLKNGIIGDIKEKSFRYIWFSPETTEKFKNFDAGIQCRHHCVYDDRNILLNTFLSLNKNHINFI